mgnify:CR=1 FL=1
MHAASQLRTPIDGLDAYESWARRVDQVRPATCLLYTSDAADERSSVDLGGRRIIKTKKLCVPLAVVYTKITASREEKLGGAPL